MTLFAVCLSLLAVQVAMFGAKSKGTGGLQKTKDSAAVHSELMEKSLNYRSVKLYLVLFLCGLSSRIHMDFSCPFSLTKPLSLSPGQRVLPTQANSNQVHNLGIVWPPTWLELARVGLNLIKLEFSPNWSHVSTVWPPQPTQANARQVVLLLRGSI